MGTLSRRGVVPSAIALSALVVGCGPKSTSTPDMMKPGPRRDMAGAPPTAMLTLSDGAAFDFGAHALGSLTDHTVTVTNAGGAAATAIGATGLADPFTITDGTFPGTGGTCTTTLDPGQSCTVVLTFAPTGAGPAANTLSVGYSDATGASGSVTLALSGSGTTDAVLAISDGPTFDYGTQAVGSSSDHAFTITNGGASTASSIAGTVGAAFAWKGGTFPGTGGTCGSTLAASANCTVVVTFAPTATGTAGSTLAVTYIDGAAMQTASVMLTGTGAPPALVSVSDGPTFDYDVVALAGSRDHTFTLTNGGGVTATAMSDGGILAPFGWKGGTYPGGGGTCAATLAPNASCTVVVTFAPTAAGPQSATLAVSYSDGAQAQSATRALSGVGAAAALLTLSDGPTYDFGAFAQGTIFTHTFTLTNQGGVAATAVAPAAGAPFSVQSTTCGARLSSLASCTITVAFDAGTTSASDTLSVAYSDGTSASANKTVSVGLSGAGTTGAALSWQEGTSYGFGTQGVGSTPTHTFTLRNRGALSANSLTVGVTGSGFAVTTNNCSSVLNSGGACTVIVTWTVAAGAASATLTASDGAGDSAACALGGTGTASAFLTATPSSFDFGARTIGSSTPTTITITNTGAATSGAISGGALGGGFVYTGGAFPGGGSCGPGLAVGGSCTVGVTFAPTTGGAASSNLTLSYDSSALQVPLGGLAIGPALLVISDGPTYDYGTRAVGSSTDHTFTITNEGTSVASLSPSSSISGAGFIGKSSTCGQAVAPADQCTITVTFAPGGNGPASGAIDLVYSDGANPQAATRNLAGTGAPPAVLSLTPATTVDFGTVAVGGSTVRTFTLTYVSGGVPAQSLGAAPFINAFSLKGGFPGQGGTCGASLSSGSCTLVVMFAPSSATGPVTDTLTVSYDSGAATQQLSTTVKADAERAAVVTIGDGNSYDFGTRADGSVTTHTFTVSNTGGVPAGKMVWGAPAAPFAFAGGAFPGTNGTCGTSLAPGANCSIVVEFAPLSPMSDAGAVTLAYDNGAGPASTQQSLAGTGAAPALLAVQSSSPFAFGAVAMGGSATQTFTVQNMGGVPAVLGASALGLDENSDFFITSDACSSRSIAPGNTCLVGIAFRPSFSTGATVTAHLGIGYDNGAAATTSSFAMTGQGVAPAVLTISPAPFGFGTQAIGSSTDQPFNVGYAGGVPATGISVNVPAGYSIKSNNCGSSISGSCQIVVTFSPSVAGTTYSGNLAIGYSDGTPASRESDAGLSGKGGNPALLAISDGATYDFGTIAVGAQPTHTFTLTNSGDVPAVVASALVGNLPYSVVSTSGCTSVAGAGGTCSVTVRFAPTASGATGDTLVVSYGNGLTTTSASRPLAGTGRTPASLAISDAPAYDYGTLASGGGADHIFYVQNGGELSAGAVAKLGSALSTGSFNWKGGTYPGIGGTCGGTLAGGSFCKLVVTFTAPALAGTVNDTLGLSYDNQLSTTSVAIGLSGTSTKRGYLRITDWPGVYYTQYGLPPDGAQYDYGTVGVSHPRDHLFTVTNTGAATATITPPGALVAPYAWKGGGYPGNGGTCGTSLAAGASCVVVVTFNPQSAAAFPSSFTIAYDDGANPQTATRNVTGTGTNDAYLVIREFPDADFGSAIDFGLVGVGGSQSMNVYLVNTGAAPATAMVASPTGGIFRVDQSACGTKLPAGAACQLKLTFAPAAVGTQNGTIQVAYNDGSGMTPPPAARAVKGTGTNAAVLAIDFDQGPVSLYDFGTHGVGSTTTKTMTLRNSGGSGATGVTFPSVGAPFANGQPFLYQPGTCTSSLAAGASCTFGVTFKPQSAGFSQAAISVAYNDPGNAQTASLGVTGFATASAYLVIQEQTNSGGGTPTGAPFDFGTHGTALSQLFSVTNLGGAAANSLSGSVGGLFSFFQASGPPAFPGSTAPGGSPSGTCVNGGSLPAGASCTILVTFTPSGTTVSTSVINVAYVDAATSTASSNTRAVTGTSSQSALVVLENSGPCSTCTTSDLSIYSYGTVGIPVDHTFYLSNNGIATATALTFATGGPQFTVKPGATTCVGGGNIPPGGNCTITITYSPSGSGLQSDILHVTYGDGSGGTPAIDKGVSGAATTNPVLQVTGKGGNNNNGGYSFGTAAAPVTATFTLTNVGGGDAAGLGGAAFTDGVFSFPGGSFPGNVALGNLCGGALAKGASCQFSVTFSPASDTASHSDNVVVDFSGGASAPFPIFGTDINVPQLSVYDFPGGSPQTPYYDFGTSGVSVQHTFYVANSGTSASNLGFTFAPGDAVFSFPASTDPSRCVAGQTLGPGATCTLLVQFTPTVDTVVHSSSVKVTSTSGPSSGARNIQGTDSNQPILTLSDCPDFKCNSISSGGGGGGQPLPPPLDFGTTGNTAARTIYVVNSGGATATLATTFTQPNASGFAYYSYQGGFPGAGGTCSSTLPSGGSCSVVLTFTRNGSDTGTNVENGALNFTAPAVSRQLTATETDKALLQIDDCQFCGASGSPFDFGTWGVKHARLFYVRNTGAAASTLSGAPFSGINATNFSYTGGGFPGTNGTCNVGTLGPGSACTVEVQFDPSGGAPGALLSGTLNINYTNGAGTVVSRALQGVATASATVFVSDNGPWDGPNFQGNFFDYGTIGTSSSHTFTVTNSGAVDATLGSELVSGAYFAFSGGGGFPGAGGNCTSPIKAGTSCTIAVTFAPTSPLSNGQQVSGGIGIAYTGGASPLSPASRALAGTYTNQPLLGITDQNCQGCSQTGAPPFDFGHWGVPVARTFYVTNSGGGPSGKLAAPAIGTYFKYTGGTFPGTKGSCPTDTTGLAAGGQCTLDVTFDPTGGSAGSASGTISLGYGASQSAARAVAGTIEPGVYFVLAANSAGWQPTTFNYGTFGSSVTPAMRQNQFWVINQGGTAATPTGSLSGHYSFAGGSFPGSGGTCTGSIGGVGNNDTCSVVVEFDPVNSDVNPQTGVLSIGYSGGPSSLVSMDLSGNGTTGAFLVLSENSNMPGSCGDACGPFDFGSYAAGSSVTESIWLTNTGNSGSGTITFTPGYAAPFSAGTSGSDCTVSQLTNGLSPGQQCTFSVLFTPPANASGNIYSGKIAASATGTTGNRNFQAEEK